MQEVRVCRLLLLMPLAACDEKNRYLALPPYRIITDHSDAAPASGLNGARCV